MKLSNTKRSIRSITTTAMLLALLVAQEELLVFIPQVQLTVVLIIVFARYLTYKELIPLILAYVFLDNMMMGSLNLLYSLPMFLSWPILGIVARTLRNKPDYVLFIWGILFAFIYSWMFIPVNMVVQSNFSVWTYFVLDLPWEIALAFNSAATFLLFYKPLCSLFDTYYQRTEEFIF
ncbi:MAG: hypothetical protein JEZ05_08350 [Tenericutes bacterium]|nr:hypothetical protein [Mycoplasmatota bacterium]